MPRKPKPPPAPYMTIEQLSALEDQRTVDDLKAKLTFVDDFTGEVREIKPEIAQRIVQRVNVIEDYAQRRKAMHIKAREEWHAVCERRRKQADEIVNKQFKPKPKAGPFKRRF